MRLKVLTKKANIQLLLFLLCLCGDVLPKNPYKSGEVRSDPKGCIYLRCRGGEQCVNRKFWCKNPPCPNMLYCARSRMESLKGPSSCESVRCSKGFVCLLRVRHCRWGEPCQQRIARCVSEREYYDGPASCVDFKCPAGLSCILRETLCVKPPCKLVKSCANNEDVTSWYEGCKSLGCLSEHECFLRRPTRNCRIYPCKHTPDCSAKSEEELEAKGNCRGWVCPKGEECSALGRGPCKRDSCLISRSCHGPLMVPINIPSAPKHSWKDDVKLSFYSKVEKNLSTSEIHHPNSDLSENDKISQGGVAQNKEIETNSTIRKFYEYPSHKAPNYMSLNSRPASLRTSSASPDIISGQVVQPTVTSLSTWLNHLKLKTGVDAIEAWIEKAEKQENCGEFLEWLESVKDMLGPDAYHLWIEEVRTMTVTSPAFQKWLPPPPTPIVPQPSVSADFIKPVGIAANENYQGLRDSSKPINYRNDENSSYPHQGMINNGLTNTSAIKNDDHNEKGYIIEPENNTILMKSGVTAKAPVTSFPGMLTSPTTVPITEWQQFGDRDPRPFGLTYPVYYNLGNGLWSNQALFQWFDAVNPMKFQQPPDIDPRFLNPGVLLGQFFSATYPQLNQRSRNQRLLELLENPDQRIQTNGSFQQPSNGDLNSLPPNSLSDQFFVPVNTQYDQFPVDRRFLVPDGGLEQQLQSVWSFPYRNPYFPRPDTWRNQFDSFINSQQQDSIDQKFWKPEEFPEHQSQANWSLQKSPNVNPNFLRNPNWQEKLFSPPTSEWSQGREPSDLFNRRNLESIKLSRSIAREGNEKAYKSYLNNSTEENTSWIKYFLDQISQKYVTLENIGTIPTNGPKLGSGRWPKSTYIGRNVANVPHLRKEAEDTTRVDVQFDYDGRDAGRSRETSPELFEVPGSHPEFPWLMDPRLHAKYLWERNSRKLYDKNDQEAPSVLSGLSRTDRFNADARSPLPKSFFVNSQRDALGLKYHWPNTYLHDRLHRMVELRPLHSSIGLQDPAMLIQAYDENPDPLSKINRPAVVGDRKIDSVYRDREFNAPEQPLAVLDLWNSRFRTPLSSVLQKFDKERLGYQNAAEKKRQISTTMAPSVGSTASVTPQQVIPIMDGYSKGGEGDDYQENIRNVKNYDDAGIYPLLLRLQGYIETSKEDEAKTPSLSTKNSTILPVYKVVDTADEDEDYRNDYKVSLNCVTDSPSYSDDRVINLFQNENYGGVPDFPNNLKNVFDVEAAMVMPNTTGESNVKIKDIKWDYEDDVEDKSVEDPSRFFVQSQGSFTSSSSMSNNKEVRGWDGSLAGSSDEDDTENDSYDDVVDYEDETILGDRNNYNFQPVRTGDLLDHEEILEEPIDSLYDDPDHKRFKKNRP